MITERGISPAASAGPPPPLPPPLLLPGRKRWHIRLLGQLQLVSGLAPAAPAPAAGSAAARPGEQTPEFLGNKKAGALLAYLAFHPGTAHPREILTEVLWPESAPSAARANLRVVLNALRKILEPSGSTPAGSVLRTDHSSIELRADAVTTDVAAFDAALSEAQAAATGDDAARIAALTRAAELYRGDLLLGHYENWILEAREQLKTQHQKALVELAQLLQGQGETDRALRCAAAAVAADPLHEENQALLMRLYIAAGDYDAALRQYRKMERTLLQQMDQSPSPAARALLKEIQSARKSDLTEAVPAAPGTAPPPQQEQQGTQEQRKAAAAALSSSSGGVTQPALAMFRVPVPLTRFLERPELEQSVRTLRAGQARLLTVTGPAGSGKTRLAIEAAGRLRDAFPGAVWFIPVAEYCAAAGPDPLIDAVFDLLRLQRSPALSPMEQVIEALGRQPTLLVLDSFEHQLKNGSGPRVVLELLQRAPTLTCLVTSQIQLRLAGERVIPLTPLPLPKKNASPERLLDNPTVRLLVDRVRMVLPEFEITAENAAEVVELCRRLEGLPLAVELAAPWVQVLSLPEIIERLEQPFDLLVSDHSDLPERHRSLQAAIRWSYDLLPPELRTFFTRLSIFESGFTLDAASAVLDEPQAARYLRHLQECSLVSVAAHAQQQQQQTQTQAGRGSRFQLLDSVRAFAARQLAAEQQTQTQEQTPQEQRDSLAQRHAEYYLALGFEAESHLGGPDLPLLEEWLEETEMSHANFRRALEWLRQNEPMQHLFLASSLWRFWYLRGHYHEGRAHLQQALHLIGGVQHLQQQQPPPPGTEAAVSKSILGLACLAYAQCDEAAGRALLRQSLEQMRALRRADGNAVFLSRLSDVARVRGDYELARSLIDEALALWQEAEPAVFERLLGQQQQQPEADTGRMLRYQMTGAAVAVPVSPSPEWLTRREIADTIRRAGDVAYCVGNLPGADLRFGQSLALFEDISDPAGIAVAHIGRGVVARAQCRFDHARSLLRVASQIRSGLGDRYGVAAVQRVLADIACREGRFPDARALIDECLTAFLALGEPLGAAGARTVASIVALAQGDAPEAQSQLREALRMAERHGHSRRAAYIHLFLSLALLLTGDQLDATSHAVGALRWFSETGDQIGLAQTLEVCAAVSSRRGEARRAAQLLGAANALRERIGAPVPPAYKALYERHLSEARAALGGETAFAAAQAQGESLPLLEAVALASLLAP